MTSDARDPSSGSPAPADLGFDPDALRAKYRAEREKRLRADGNDQYREVKGAFARFVEDPYVDPGLAREPLHDELEVAVIGGGFGGLLAGARLREAGVEDVRIIEKGGDFGGTWYWNRYPGAMCDVESYIYLPLLEELGSVPTEKYARAPEILAHAQAIGRKYDLYRGALFQTEVTEMRWDEAAARWILSTQRGDRLRARFVCMPTGPLNRAEASGHPGHRDVRGPRLPHQPLGLRLHRRRFERESHRPARTGASASSAPAPRPCSACRISARRPSICTSSSARPRRSTCAPTVPPIRSGRLRSRPAGTSTGWTTSTSWCRAASRPRTW